MLTNPTTPNLSDYTTFLYGAVGIPAQQLPTASGTATGGSTTTLVDISKTWATNQWAGYFVCDSTQGEIPVIASSNANTLTFFAPVPNAIAAGDAYLIIPDSVYTSFIVSMETVNETLNCASPTLYTLAVYNLAADRLINFANDQPNQTYFRDVRDKFKISVVSVGVVSGTSDEGTSTNLLNPEAMRMLTLQDLQTLKTPYGRYYMGIAQDYGSTIWGLT
jgi:hypothetical protein